MTQTLASGADDTRNALRVLRRAVSERRQQHHEHAQRHAVDSLERRLLEGRADENADLIDVLANLEEFFAVFEAAHVNETVETQAEPTITVEELAAAIRQTVGATRRLLNRDLIPGARRVTPGIKNSPWLIPASAPSRYLATFRQNGH